MCQFHSIHCYIVTRRRRGRAKLWKSQYNDPNQINWLTFSIVYQRGGGGGGRRWPSVVINIIIKMYISGANERMRVNIIIRGEGPMEIEKRISFPYPDRPLHSWLASVSLYIFEKLCAWLIDLSFPIVKCNLNPPRRREILLVYHGFRNNKLWFLYL